MPARGGPGTGAGYAPDTWRTRNAPPLGNPRMRENRPPTPVWAIGNGTPADNCRLGSTCRIGSPPTTDANGGVDRFGTTLGPVDSCWLRCWLHRSILYGIRTCACVCEWCAPCHPAFF